MRSGWYVGHASDTNRQKIRRAIDHYYAVFPGKFIVTNFLTSTVVQDLLLSVLFVDEVLLASERVVKLQEIFEKTIKILGGLQSVSQSTFSATCDSIYYV